MRPVILPVLLGVCVLALAVAAGEVRAGSPTVAVASSRQAVAQGDAQAAIEQAFAAEGIHLDLARGLCSIPAEVLVRGELLEYLLVNPRGAAHESAFLTNIGASRINAALLALGVEPGRNARWQRRDPPPTLEELRAGAPAYDVTPPEGDGFFLSVAWKIDGEVHHHRMEDLLLDLRVGQTMRRHRWVYLGSRMLRLRPGEPEEAFAADLEGNLICIAFFEQGNTLLTGALPECIDQTIWQSNYWLLPAQGSPVEIVFSRAKLATLPDEIERRLGAAQRVAPLEER